MIVVFKLPAVLNEDIGVVCGLSSTPELNKSLYQSRYVCMTLDCCLDCFILDLFYYSNPELSTSIIYVHVKHLLNALTNTCAKLTVK